jgi:hypothetical protein
MDQNPRVVRDAAETPPPPVFNVPEGGRKGTVSIILMGVLGVLGCGAALLDAFDLLEATNALPEITIALLTAMALYLLQERREEHRELRRAVAERDQQLVSALRSLVVGANDEQTHVLVRSLDRSARAEVRVWEDQESYYRRLAYSVTTARKSVDDLTWGAVSEPTRSREEALAFERYVNSLKDMCRQPSPIRVREIFTFPSQGRLDRARALLGETGLDSYFVRYFDVNHDALPPLMQFTIIDREELILGTHRGGLRSAEGERYLSVRHPEIVRLFAAYFDTIWTSGRPLLDAQTRDFDALERIQGQLQRKKAGKKPPPASPAQ